VEAIEDRTGVFIREGQGPLDVVAFMSTLGEVLAYEDARMTPPDALVDELRALSVQVDDLLDPM